MRSTAVALAHTLVPPHRPPVPTPRGRIPPRRTEPRWGCVRTLHTDTTFLVDSADTDRIMRKKNYRPPASPPYSDDEDNTLPLHTDSARFSDTRALLAYGVKLGLGKAAQEQAIAQLQQQLPEQAALLDNPMFLAGLKMALPLVGIQLAQHLRSEALADRVRDASQGMLLVNTIDTAADVTQAASSQVIDLGRFLLGLYGITGADAEEGARQLAHELGIEALSASGARTASES